MLSRRSLLILCLTAVAASDRGCNGIYGRSLRDAAVAAPAAGESLRPQPNAGQGEAAKDRGMDDFRFVAFRSAKAPLLSRSERRQLLIPRS
jgi:hypothetical protein